MTQVADEWDPPHGQQELPTTHSPFAIIQLLFIKQTTKKNPPDDPQLKMATTIESECIR